MNDCFNCFPELRAEGWLAISANGNVPKPQQIRRHRRILWIVSQLSGVNERERRFQFRRHHVQIEFCVAPRREWVHFTIETIKVALLVRGKIYTHV